MPLPAGFTAQHYNDIPLFEVSASARARYRAFVAKAWSEEETARAAFSGQSLSRQDTRYKVERLLGEIFGNIPETSFFGEPVSGGYPYTINEWDADANIHDRQGTADNDGHVPANLIPFPYAANPNILHTNNTASQTRIYSLSGSMHWPWSVGPVFFDTSSVAIEWLVYQGAGTPVNSLRHHVSRYSAGERGHAVEEGTPLTNPFGMEFERDYAINTDAGGKVIRETLQIPDPRSLQAQEYYTITGEIDPDATGNYYPNGDTIRSEPVYEREGGVWFIWRGVSVYHLSQGHEDLGAGWLGQARWARGVSEGLEGVWDDRVPSNGATGSPIVTAGISPIVGYGLDHFLTIQSQVRLANSDQTCAILGGRFVFGNRRGVGLEMFSPGFTPNDPAAWVSRNVDAVPYWVPIMGAPDVVIINYSRSSGTSTYEKLYDEINDVIDVWKAANPNVLIILASNRYSAGSPSDASAEYRTHYGSVYRQIALDRDDVMFFNQMRWLDNRANHTPAHSVGNLGDRDKGVYSGSTTYNMGDVVRVNRGSASPSPEGRGVTQYYICLADDVTDIRPGVDPLDTGLKSPWAYFNQMLNDDVHPHGELERHRCLSYAQLLSGTFPDRTANELLGLTGGLGGRIWAPGTWANGTFAN